MTASTSAETYRAITEDGTIRARRDEAFRLACIATGYTEPRTAREIVGERDPHELQKRFSELVSSGALVEHAPRPCSISGRRVKTYVAVPVGDWVAPEHASRERLLTIGAAMGDIIEAVTRAQDSPHLTGPHVGEWCQEQYRSHCDLCSRLHQIKAAALEVAEINRFNESRAK